MTTMTRKMNVKVATNNEEDWCIAHCPVCAVPSKTLLEAMNIAMEGTTPRPRSGLPRSVERWLEVWPAGTRARTVGFLLLLERLWVGLRVENWRRRITNVGDRRGRRKRRMRGEDQGGMRGKDQRSTREEEGRGRDLEVDDGFETGLSWK
jgi:hypothetical protein